MQNQQIAFFQLRAMEILLGEVPSGTPEVAWQARNELVSAFEDGVYILDQFGTLYQKGGGSDLPRHFNLPDFMAGYGNNDLRGYHMASKPMLFQIEGGKYLSIEPETKLLCLATWDKPCFDFWEEHAFPNGSSYFTCTLQGVHGALGGEIKVIRGNGAIHYRSKSDYVVYRRSANGQAKPDDWLKP